MFITTMLVRLTNNDVMMQASVSAKSQRLGRTVSCLCYAYAPILAIREQPNLRQLHVVHIYLIPYNIFFEARNMIQMEARPEFMPPLYIANNQSAHIVGNN